MEARDRERLERMAKEAQERAAANAAKKKKAEERIAGESGTGTHQCMNGLAGVVKQVANNQWLLSGLTVSWWAGSICLLSQGQRLQCSALLAALLAQCLCCPPLPCCPGCNFSLCAVVARSCS